ncbi:helix-turn-helix domain-containing protein [Saxibacter everestensis]|uniref:Helix-turn-helix domain-containing protein n=1 Tax=Saxibacter everestensis TaxID=2909229 RepID=A0ABY8QV94_9MICO|nr:helix-turn-helix domain-containing protein [Brevibacteriaceae bacterium ZFBP1038]
MPHSKGVLFPGRQRPGLSFKRYSPAAELADVVTHYWIPRWDLRGKEPITQEIIQYPTSNLVVEPEQAALYGVTLSRGTRRLAGQSWAFGAMLAPGAGYGLLGRSLVSIRNGQAELDGSFGEAVPTRSAAGLVAELRAVGGSDADLIRVFERWLLTRESLWDAETVRCRREVNDLVKVVADNRDVVRVEELALRANRSVRGLQRLTRDYIGVSPKWIISRYRLQEAAYALAEAGASEAETTLTELAFRLGYADQAHFSRDFKSTIGIGPREYLRRNILH